ncbi:hypothetical protein [Burkholderia pseudomallei]|uniref:hypothetical protein n=1 Tax=Burkholderia pseudomallei TaxID=28450 RepID=UPI0012B17498|nr:hypothetical protein [Burkholderia pseudomallei]
MENQKKKVFEAWVLDAKGNRISCTTYEGFSSKDEVIGHESAKPEHAEHGPITLVFKELVDRKNTIDKGCEVIAQFGLEKVISTFNVFGEDISIGSGETKQRLYSIDIEQTDDETKWFELAYLSKAYLDDFSIKGVEEGWRLSIQVIDSNGYLGFPEFDDDAMKLFSYFVAQATLPTKSKPKVKHKI